MRKAAACAMAAPGTDPESAEVTRIIEPLRAGESPVAVACQTDAITAPGALPMPGPANGAAPGEPGGRNHLTGHRKPRGLGLRDEQGRPGQARCYRVPRAKIRRMPIGLRTEEGIGHVCGSREVGLPLVDPLFPLPISGCHGLRFEQALQGNRQRHPGELLRERLHRLC